MPPSSLARNWRPWQKKRPKPPNRKRPIWHQRLTAKTVDNVGICPARSAGQILGDRPPALSFQLLTRLGSAGTPELLDRVGRLGRGFSWDAASPAFLPRFSFAERRPQSVDLRRRRRD